MLLLRVYEQWRRISFLEDHFSAVARGRNLCVLILVCLVSAFVGLCWVDQVCGRRLLFLVCLEGVVICYEGTDSLAEVTDLDADTLQESVACPSSHDHDFYGYTLTR